MKLLLDHCVDRRLARLLGGHEVATAALSGWSTLRNGALLQAAAAAGFQVMITTDANLQHEQNLAQLPLAVIVLRARSNRLTDLRPLVPRLLLMLSSPITRSLIEISAE